MRELLNEPRYGRRSLRISKLGPVFFLRIGCPEAFEKPLEAVSAMITANGYNRNLLQQPLSLLDRLAYFAYALRRRRSVCSLLGPQSRRGSSHHRRMPDREAELDHPPRNTLCKCRNCQVLRIMRGSHNTARVFHRINPGSIHQIRTNGPNRPVLIAELRRLRD
jgi:hypothetical protein